MKKYFDYRNGKIHYTDMGMGEVIVLLHGYLESSEVWNSFVQKLSGGFRMISVDLPGHGHSDIYGESHTMEFMATVVKDLLKYFNVEKAFIAGHSLGGYVSLAFLELYPDALSGYCLFHSHPFADSPEVLDKREREIKLVKAGEKDLIYPDNIVKMFAADNLEKFMDALYHSRKIASKISGEGIIAVLRGMMSRPSRLSLMEEGKVPCLWILGAKDNYIDCEQVQAKVRLPLNAKVVILENSGHLGFIEEEELSLKVLTEFIKKIG
ncbi:MAG: alpha/beta hydrolase [Bacteroidales bacterium]|nr:alpha/beta hydrolase [Bacteroidales bacterium]